MGKTTSKKTKWGEVTITQNFPDVFKKVDGQKLERELNFILTREVLPTIDKGLSPVSKQRAFAKYKDPKKYPGKLKQNNKPNLTLTGEMLSYYEARVDKNDPLNATMGIHSDAPERDKMLANVHGKGTRKDIPRRAFIPDQKKGETFTAKITAAIRRAFGFVISEALAADLNKKKGVNND